jgi:hypothetical protein
MLQIRKVPRSLVADAIQPALATWGQPPSAVQPSEARQSRSHTPLSTHRHPEEPQACAKRTPANEGSCTRCPRQNPSRCHPEQSEGAAVSQRRESRGCPTSRCFRDVGVGSQQDRGTQTPECWHDPCRADTPVRRLPTRCHPEEAQAFAKRRPPMKDLSILQGSTRLWAYRLR